MGRVKVQLIKRVAKELLERYPDRFSQDFDANKRAVEELTNIESKKVRDQIAGYIVSLLKARR